MASNQHTINKQIEEFIRNKDAGNEAYTDKHTKIYDFNFSIADIFTPADFRRFISF